MKWKFGKLSNGRFISSAMFGLFAFFLIGSSSACISLQGIQENTSAIKRDVEIVKDATEAGLGIFKEVVDDLGLLSKEGTERVEKLFARHEDEKSDIMARYKEEKEDRQKQMGMMEILQWILGIIAFFFGADKLKLFSGAGAIFKAIAGAKKGGGKV